jgi:hypothetical protein
MKAKVSSALFAAIYVTIIPLSGAEKLDFNRYIRPIL